MQHLLTRPQREMASHCGLETEVRPVEEQSRVTYAFVPKRSISERFFANVSTKHRMEIVIMPGNPLTFLAEFGARLEPGP